MNAKTNTAPRPPKRRILQYGLPLSAKAGIFVNRIWQGMPDQDHDIYVPHRDTQFLLLLLFEGSFTMGLDFEVVFVQAPCVLLICPWQMHHLIGSREPRGLTIDFDPSLMPDDLQHILSGPSGTNHLLHLREDVFAQTVAIAELMHQLHQAGRNAFTRRSVHALLHALLNLIGGSLEQEAPTVPHKGRSLRITTDFRKLLARQFKHWKKPSEYAAALSITVAHLNDSVQSVTGNTVSGHVQQQIILEAKRLLHTSQLNVKEIGYALGYEDPVYFSRLFKKVTGKTPLEFRSEFRDL